MKTMTAKDRRKSKSRVVGFQVLEKECIWMKAGVVNFRQCDNDYDCNSCPFDKGMRKAMNIGDALHTEAVAPRWVDRVSWLGSKVFVNLPRASIKDKPEYDPSALARRVSGRHALEHHGWPKF